MSAWLDRRLTPNLNIPGGSPITQGIGNSQSFSPGGVVATLGLAK